ncbi:MAG: sigma-70 family RNA polymerase sigma factor [Planctomycetota bacterium]|nr:sigma-70 family RNA polymerase sigma factor [Planctomycetota bacterium]MDA1105164.1 sigma-70 family RNA polymerase sigma factor [Planctomycetota bacterium]
MTLDISTADRLLMQSVARGDAAAIGRMYDQFGRFVYRQAMQVLPTRAEAEDAVQDIFVQLWQTAAVYDADKSRLISWVALMTRRLLIDRLRAARSRPRLQSIASFDVQGGDWGPAAANANTDDFEQSPLRRRIRALPASQRAVLESVYLEGKSIRETSEALGIPSGTVKSALSRGLETMRKGFSRESLA